MWADVPKGLRRGWVAAAAIALVLAVAACIATVEVSVLYLPAFVVCALAAGAAWLNAHPDDEDDEVPA